jgi:hypothetical protein
MGLHQSKKLPHTKETINRVKRQFIEWEEIFTNCPSDKGLEFRAYKKHKELNNKKVIILFLNGQQI